MIEEQKNFAPVVPADKSEYDRLIKNAKTDQPYALSFDQHVQVDILRQLRRINAVITTLIVLAVIYGIISFLVSLGQVAR